VTRSPKTIKHIVGTLRRILDTALDDRAIQRTRSWLGGALDKHARLKRRSW